jgi:ElaB/YqjD/DUF883 family membrane-anchored ribosome-binding protein
MAKINGPQSSGQTGESIENEHSDTLRGSEQHSASGRASDDGGLRQTADHFVAQNPYSSVLTGFGIGFGFGLMVTLLLSRREETWYESHVPESLQQWPKELKRVPERVASQVSQAWNRW